MAWITKTKLKKRNPNGKHVTAYMVEWRDAQGHREARTFHRDADTRSFKAMIEAEVESRRRVDAFETASGSRGDSHRMTTLTARTTGEALTLLRRRSGMTRDDLAKTVGRAPATVWGLKTDQRTNVNM